MVLNTVNLACDKRAYAVLVFGNQLCMPRNVFSFCVYWKSINSPLLTLGWRVTVVVLLFIRSVNRCYREQRSLLRSF